MTDANSSVVVNINVAQLKRYALITLVKFVIICYVS